MKKKNKRIVYWTEKIVQWGRVFEFNFQGYVKKYFQRKGVRYAKIAVIDTVSYDMEVKASQLKKKCGCRECK